jgi:hypothetical protein
VVWGRRRPVALAGMPVSEPEKPAADGGELERAVPGLGSWPRLYALLLGELALVVALLYALAWWAE